VLQVKDLKKHSGPRPHVQTQGCICGTGVILEVACAETLSLVGSPAGGK